MSSMRWPEFRALTLGLLSANSRLARFLTPDDPDTTDAEGD